MRTILLMCFLLTTVNTSAAPAKEKAAKAERKVEPPTGKLVQLDVSFTDPDTMDNGTMQVELEVPNEASAKGHIAGVTGGWFAVSIDTATPMETERSMLKAQQAKLVVDEKDRVVFQEPGANSPFGVIMRVKVDGHSVACTSLRGIPTRADVDVVERACRSAHKAPK